MDDTAKMKIGALAPWFGGKRNLAPTIIKLLGKHRVYWEPFCGSMAVLLNKEPCVMETVNDLHGDLINLARVVQNEDTALKLFGRLKRTMMHEQLHTEAANRYRARGYSSQSDEPNIDRAYDYFLCAWMGRNGVAGTQSYNQGFCVRYTANGGHAAKRWRSVIDSIPAWYHRLCNVTILNRNAFEILGRIEDKEGTAIYIDPPYLVKGAKYIYDFKPEEHYKLAEALRRFEKSRVVVSYYDHPQLAEMYPGWSQHKIDVSKAMSNAGSRGEKDVRAVEVLLVNSKRDLFDTEKSVLS
ncbi:MAG: DNA adenine methylase [Sedimentisphaerales bacterium]|nr:DNA adenine methylase [Sedimentisphaerales bacterium]